MHSIALGSTFLLRGDLVELSDADFSANKSARFARGKDSHDLQVQGIVSWKTPK